MGCEWAGNWRHKSPGYVRRVRGFGGDHHLADILKLDQVETLQEMTQLPIQPAFAKMASSFAVRCFASEKSGKQEKWAGNGQVWGGSEVSTPSRFSGRSGAVALCASASKADIGVECRLLLTAARFHRQNFL